jgi:hypothetical protein
MTVMDSLAAVACRSAVHHAYNHAYREGCLNVGLPPCAVPPHWLGLSAALSQRCLSADLLLTEPALWAELTPFLLIPSEHEAVAALAEYAVFRAHPVAADIERLGLAVNPALHRLDITDHRVVAFLDDAMVVYRPAWLAIASYETLCWIRRSLEAARRLRTEHPEWCGKGGPLWLKRGPVRMEH